VTKDELVDYLEYAVKIAKEESNKASDKVEQSYWKGVIRTYNELRCLLHGDD
jgi:hypothetical protein